MTFKEALVGRNGLWQYKDGAKYLALLASGKISDIFCNVGAITTFPDLLLTWGSELADDVMENLDARTSFPGRDAKNVCVVGPGMGGVTLAYELAHSFASTGEPFDISTEFMALFTEPTARLEHKDITQPAVLVKDQAFRFDLPQDHAVLLCEDVITTGGSVQKTLNAICANCAPTLIPVVACLVDRRAEKGPLKLSLNRADQSGVIVTCDVVSLLKLEARTWDTLEAAQKDCPTVVEAIRPKANWAKLIGG